MNNIHLFFIGQNKVRNDRSEKDCTKSAIKSYIRCTAQGLLKRLKKKKF